MYKNIIPCGKKIVNPKQKFVDLRGSNLATSNANCSTIGRTVNKTNEFFKLMKALVKLFQKLARWRLRKPPRPPQRAKFSFRRFFL